MSPSNCFCDLTAGAAKPNIESIVPSAVDFGNFYLVFQRLSISIGRNSCVQKSDMYRTRIPLIALCIVFAVAQVAAEDDKPLGDVARQSREQEAKKSGKTAKMVTNEDIPEAPLDSKDADNHKPEHGQRNNAPGVSADQVRGAIQAQKSRIAALQAEINKLSASVHYVEANRYNNGAEYNQYQQRKQQEVERLQKQLENEKNKLDQMQESARKAGFGNAVYDP